MVDVIAAFEQGIAAGKAPGGQLCISKNGVRVVDCAAGVLAPGDATATHTAVAYDLASLTKVLATTYLTGRALQYGLCTLDDQITRFVPMAHAGVTVRHLLEHTSGYPAHKHFYDDLPAGAHDAYDHCVKAAARTLLQTTPGTQICYSDLGFILLGAAIERMFAEPLRALVRLAGVFFPHGEALTYAPTAHLSLADDRAPVAIPPGVVHDGNCRAMGGAAGHAGLFGTASAVEALGTRWLAAARGEDPAFMQARVVEALLAPSRVLGRATGWDKASLGGATGDVWPTDSVGHLGYTGTALWLSPSARLVCAMITNRACSLAELKAFRRSVYAAAFTQFGEG